MYDPIFFKQMKSSHREYAANTVIHNLKEKYGFDRVVDVGCGVGIWSKACLEAGCKEICGADGDYLPIDELVIPEKNFQVVDLATKGFSDGLPQKNDLAICIEVAEHLPADRAFSFVEELTLLSDTVLFSAAVPLQGGINHVNEQWQSYWKSLFGQFNYACLDIVRPLIWNDEKVLQSYYKQNIFLYSRDKSVIANSQQLSSTYPVDLVHPDLFSLVLKREQTIRENTKLCRRVANVWKRFVG